MLIKVSLEALMIIIVNMVIIVIIFIMVIMVIMLIKVIMIFIKGESGGADGADQAKGSWNEDEELKWGQTSIFFSFDIPLEKFLSGTETWGRLKLQFVPWQDNITQPFICQRSHCSSKNVVNCSSTIPMPMMPFLWQHR